MPFADRLRLLVVDDDEVDRRAVRRALRAAGVDADVEEAPDAPSALAAIRAGAWDCVFLDYQLPGGDGLRVLSTARAEGLDVPVIMLTGMGDQETAVELMKAGAADYVAKASITPDRLAQGLRHAVRVHRADRAARRAEAEREVAIASRSRFYAAMSHELRTPINAILGYNDLILAGVYGPLADGQAGALERAQRAARHLLDLVNDVLDVSKLEAGKMEVEAEPFSVAELVHDLFATVRPLARERGSELHLVEDASSMEVVSDPRRVRQILLNLISNALKFGEGKPVEVRCAALDGHVQVEVVDRGGGIGEHDLARVFEEFVQLPNANQQGTGLGLPISRRLAELLGGRLEADSRPGEGSTFRLILPRAAELDPAADAESA